MTYQSVKATTARGTGVICLLPQTHSSARLSCVLNCHWTEGRAVYRGCWASPLTIWAPKTLEGLPGTPICVYRCLFLVVCFCEDGHCFPAPKPINHALDWVWSLEGEHLLSMVSITPTVPDTMTSRLKALLGNAKYVSWMNNMICHLAALDCYPSLVLIFNYLSIWVSSVPT